MNRVFLKTLNIAFTLLFASNIAFGLDAEYKNSLLKVELTRTGDENYNINLYTKKNFQEPVKIIKKSDLNYYILLPETNNQSPQNNVNFSDIRSISTKVFPYAGADINNGYTKIDITTTRPLNFNLTTKNSTQEHVQNKPKQQPQPKTQPKTQPAKNDIQTSQKTTKQPVQSASQKPKIAPSAQNKTSAEKKTKTSTAKKERSKEAVKIAKEAQKPAIKKEEQKPEEIFEPTVKEEIINEPQVAQNPPEMSPIAQEEDDNGFAQGYEFLDESKNDFVSKLKRKFVPYKNMIEIKAQQYGLTFWDIVLMSLAGLLSFIVMLIVLSKKPQQPKLKSKADLVDEADKKPKKKKPQEKSENKAQYFVFDNNTAKKLPQTNRIQKRKYELSNYNPEIEKNKQNSEKTDSFMIDDEENEIIHKILREDSYSDIEIQPQAGFSSKKEEAEIENITIEEPEVAQISEVPAQEDSLENSEPVVLSSIEIAPRRGFMCISYENNVRLMGYIFDDVFALYNFKKSELDDYNIKFRLSEKTEKTANFIVKVDKTKLLIAVTNSSMSLEVAM